MQPKLEDIRNVQTRLRPYILETQTQYVHSERIARIIAAEFWFKLELFQHTGTFKARGALNTLLQLGKSASRVTAFSAGNHAIAVAFAAARTGADAKVLMQKTANPMRIALAQDYGAEVVLVEPGKAGFDKAMALAEEENRYFVHPFEGPMVTTATGGIGVELLEAQPTLEAVIVAIGGGGLASGIAAAVKQLNPKCAVYGVEPDGAAAMRHSFKNKTPSTLSTISTIADSLAPPMTTPYAYSVCQHFIDDLVTVSDEEIEMAMALMFADYKLAVEPAGAAALAAAIGPLRHKLRGKRIGFIICGSNIDHESFAQHVKRGHEKLKQTEFAA